MAVFVALTILVVKEVLHQFFIKSFDDRARRKNEKLSHPPPRLLDFGIVAALLISGSSQSADAPGVD
jgi:hypothetical protein